MDIKEAIRQAESWGYARWDFFRRNGSVVCYQEGDVYGIRGEIDGVKVEATTSEEGLDRTLQELNVDPKNGWYSL